MNLGEEVVESPPNLAKMLRFFGLLPSSFISSNSSSMCVDSSIITTGDSLGSFSMLGLVELSNCEEDRDESVTGDRAEMSYSLSVRTSIGSSGRRGGDIQMSDGSLHMIPVIL